MIYIHVVNISRTDLNLLVVFAAVARTGSVTKAAHALALSQPAVSHALNRLRDVVKDPLFVRVKGGLMPTPRAARMIVPASSALQAASAVFAEDAFDPAVSSATFRVAVSDYAALTTVPKLARALRKASPRATLELASVDDRTLDQLEAGALDCSFWGVKPPPAPFEARFLYRERYVGMMSSRHPLGKQVRQRKIGLKDYLAYPHAMVRFGAARRSTVDEALAARGQARHIAVATPGFSSILALLPGSDLIASVPSRLADLGRRPGLAVFDLPFDVPEFSYALIWHRRKSDDSANRWLRDRIASSAMS